MIADDLAVLNRLIYFPSIYSVDFEALKGVIANAGKHIQDAMLAVGFNRMQQGKLADFLSSECLIYRIAIVLVCC